MSGRCAANGGYQLEVQRRHYLQMRWCFESRRVTLLLVPECHQPTPVCAWLQGGAGIQGMGVSMVDALSTLKVMGLEEEFKQ